MKVTIDRTLCEDNAICVGVAPEVFGLDDNSHMVLLDDTPSEEVHAKVVEAAMLCPVQAILLEEAD